MAGSYEHGKPLWRSTNGGESLGQLSDYRLLKEDFFMGFLSVRYSSCFFFTVKLYHNDDSSLQITLYCEIYHLLFTCTRNRSRHSLWDVFITDRMSLLSRFYFFVHCTTCNCLPLDILNPFMIRQ